MKMFFIDNQEEEEPYSRYIKLGVTQILTVGDMMTFFLINGMPYSILGIYDIANNKWVSHRVFSEQMTSKLFL